MTKTMTNTLCRDFFCRLHFSLAVIVPDIYRERERVHWYSPRTAGSFYQDLVVPLSYTILLEDMLGIKNRYAKRTCICSW
jgi:hypothetical protein